MKSQLHEYEVRSVTILGIAGGNDLQQIDCSRIKAVYGIDINQSHLDACREKYRNLKDLLVHKKSDLSDIENGFPAADMIIGNLFIE